MTSEAFPLHSRLSDVLRTLEKLSSEGTVEWKQLKVAPDSRAEHIRRTLVSKGNRWASLCDARAVVALLYYLRKRGYFNDAFPDAWIIDSKKIVHQNAEFPEPAFAVRCNQLLGALRAEGHETDNREEVRIAIAGNLHAHLVGLLIGQGDYWAEGHRFGQNGEQNAVRRAFMQLVQRRLVRTEPSASGKGTSVLVVRSQGQF